MTWKTAVYLPLTFLCGTLLLAQNWQPTDGNWTDKNNTEKYAAYLLEMTYYQQGYVRARVEIKQDGSKRLFIMEPGEVFHLNDVVVTGLRDFPTHKLMQDGPKSGDVFRPDRINDWLEQIRNKFAKNAGPLESVTWGVKFDRAHSQANVQVIVKERN
jgi:outer membrane protein assembly factor BamA